MINIKNLRSSTIGLAFLLVPALVLASECTFDRTLNVSGQAMLNVSTGSGNIHVYPGGGNQIHVVGHAKAGNWSWGGGSAEERVKRVCDNPPVVQTGNEIRIGKSSDDSLKNVSIDYEIAAPANSQLVGSTGSGDVKVEGVGSNAKLTTGSGNIVATGLSGGFTVETGSGDIHANQTSAGDVRAETGSGNIHLTNVEGALRVQTGSGDIEISGKPTANWRITSGSGNAILKIGGAAITLDASTGSGNIKSDIPMSVEGALNKSHVTGKINGGGPTVRVETGSGNIQVR